MIFPRRSLGARVEALRIMQSCLDGKRTLKHLRESEKTEINTCIGQTIEFLERAIPKTKEILALLEGEK